MKVIIPTIDLKKADQIARLMFYRAGMKCEILVVEDTERKGWVKVINDTVREYPDRYYVYAADDAYPSRGFLKGAYDQMISTGAGIVAFNEGKYQDLSAGFALVDREWTKEVYGEDILFSGYKSHFSDVEIALIAKAQGRYAYNPRNCLVEIVFDKDGPNPKSNNKDDYNLFYDRASKGFGGLTRPFVQTIR